MRHGERGTSVQQDLEDLVVVHVGGQDERCDVRGEVRDGAVYCFPALREHYIQLSVCVHQPVVFPLELLLEYSLFP